MTTSIPNQTVRLMREIGGKPTQHGREFLEGLDRTARTQQAAIDDLETGKADAATTLAGYGITDAERLGKIRGFNIQTGNYTVQQSDAGYLIIMDSSSPQTLTWPAGLESETYANWMQAGTGQLTHVHGGGGGIASYNNALKSAGQYAQGTAATNGVDWFLSGTLVP